MTTTTVPLVRSLIDNVERADAALDHEWQPCDRPPRVRRAAGAAPLAPTPAPAPTPPPPCHATHAAAPVEPAAPAAKRARRSRKTAAPAPAAVTVAPGMLATREDQRRYILAGYVDAGGGAHGGRFTIVSRESGTRYTYRVKPPPGPGKEGSPCRKCVGGFWRGNKRYTCFTCKGSGLAVAAPADGPERLFVAVLTGSDNTSDYSYLGQIITRPHPRYEHGRKSRISDTAPSAKAATWYLSRLFANEPVDEVEVWHDGSCARCGRDLTDPLSVTRGIGPDCWERMGLG